MTIAAIQSLTTKIEYVNKVLLQAGEREVTTTSDNTAANKVTASIQSSMNFVNSELPWQELVSYVTYPTDGTAHSDLNIMGGVTGMRIPTASYLRVLDVYNTDAQGYVPYLQPVTLQRYTGSAPKWTNYMGLIFVRPAITCAVFYVRRPTVPVFDDDVFEAPEFLVDLYVKRSLITFAARQLGDADLVNAVRAEYLEELMKLSTSYAEVPSSVRNVQPSSDTEYRRLNNANE